MAEAAKESTKLTGKGQVEMWTTVLRIGRCFAHQARLIARWISSSEGDMMTEGMLSSTCPPHRRAAQSSDQERPQFRPRAQRGNVRAGKRLAHV